MYMTVRRRRSMMSVSLSSGLGTWVTQTQYPNKKNKENDADADAPTAIPLELAIWASLFSPASRDDTTRTREQAAQFEATHQFSGSTDHLPYYISLPQIADRETNTTQDVSNADKMSHRGTKGQENDSGGKRRGQRASGGRRIGGGVSLCRVVVSRRVGLCNAMTRGELGLHTGELGGRGGRARKQRRL